MTEWQKFYIPSFSTGTLQFGQGLVVLRMTSFDSRSHRALSALRGSTLYSYNHKILAHKHQDREIQPTVYSVLRPPDVNPLPVDQGVRSVWCWV